MFFYLSQGILNQSTLEPHLTISKVSIKTYLLYPHRMKLAPSCTDWPVLMSRVCKTSINASQENLNASDTKHITVMVDSNIKTATDMKVQQTKEVLLGANYIKLPSQGSVRIALNSSLFIYKRQVFPIKSIMQTNFIILQYLSTIENICKLVTVGNTLLYMNLPHTKYNVRERS